MILESILCPKYEHIRPKDLYAIIDEFNCSLPANDNLWQTFWWRSCMLMVYSHCLKAYDISGKPIYQVVALELLWVCLDWTYCCWKLKTENWKHCSKIIFKCVHSTVWPIFNMWTVYAQCVNSTYTVHNSKICLLKSTNAGKKKKKKAENVNAEPKPSHN